MVEQVSFNVATHTYKDAEGVVLPSVTSIIDSCEPAGGLLSWAAKSVADEAIRCRDQLASIDTDEELERARNYLARSSARVRDTAGVFGTAVHAGCEALAKGQRSTREMSDAARATVEHFHRFLVDYGVVVWGSEYRVWHERLRYAGTVDLAIQSPQVAGAETIVADIKTSASMYSRPSYSYGKLSQQMAAYAHATPTDSGVPDTHLLKGLAVLVRPEGYKVVKIDLAAGWEQFQRSLETYQWRKANSSYGEIL